MRSTFTVVGVSIVLGGLGLAAAAATQSERVFKWKVHDMNRPQPTAVDPGPATPATPATPAWGPPSDAVVLLGQDHGALAHWTGRDGPPKWTVADGVMTVAEGTGDIRTTRTFGDVQAHIEWMVPAGRKVDGQQGGNSGVFFMDRYELQIVSSNGNTTYADGMAGSLYGQYPPLVNACRPQGSWNVFDVVFRAPVFDAAGAVLQPATITAFLNGVLVQDHSELLGSTAHATRAAYEKHDPTGAIRLQDHGDPISFRNIWVRPLPSRAAPE